MTFGNLARRESFSAIKPHLARQERTVYEYLSAHGPSTPSEIHNGLSDEGFKIPLTSIRRACTYARDKRWIQEVGLRMGEFGVLTTVYSASPLLAPVKVEFDGDQAVLKW